MKKILFSILLLGIACSTGAQVQIMPGDDADGSLPDVSESSREGWFPLSTRSQSSQIVIDEKDFPVVGITVRMPERENPLLVIAASDRRVCLLDPGIVLQEIRIDNR